MGAQKLGYKMKKAGFRATNECSLQESGESIEGLGLLEQQEWYRALERPITDEWLDVRNEQESPTDDFGIP